MRTFIMTTVTMALPCFVLFRWDLLVYLVFCAMNIVLCHTSINAKGCKWVFQFEMLSHNDEELGQCFLSNSIGKAFCDTTILLCYTVPFGLRLFYSTPEMSEWLIRINFSHSILIHSRDLFWLNKLLKKITQVYACAIGDIFQFCFNFPWTWAKFASCFAIFD